MKQRIGIIYCCYGNPEYIEDCLRPWIESKEKFDIKIAAVHGQFKEYHDLGIEDNDFDVQQNLIGLSQIKSIDYLYLQNQQWLKEFIPIYQTEAEIRDKGLQWLLQNKCETIWLLDNDEIYTIEQIRKIIEYINRYENRFDTWFSIPMKNYIFSGKEWIRGFCPPRIFRRSINTYMQSYTLRKCFWDNDFEYQADTGITKSYQEFSSKMIPENLLNGGIRHLTWLHENGEKKVMYQTKHFGQCSYQWNKELNKLEFDLNYHKRHNLSLPEVNFDL